LPPPPRGKKNSYFHEGGAGELFAGIFSKDLLFFLIFLLEKIVVFHEGGGQLFSGFGYD